jgi:hypothetical protein
VSADASPRNLEEARLAIVARLPFRSRWLLRDTPWDWDFSRARRPLQPLADGDAEVWQEVLPPDWRHMFIFGEQDFAEGGGARPFVTVHAQTGEVWGLDVERERSAAFLLNSSIAAFIDSFLVLDDVLRSGAMPRVDLRGRLRAADPVSFENSDWRELVDNRDGVY